MGSFSRLEEFREHDIPHRIADVLEAVDLHVRRQDGLGVLHVAQPLDRERHGADGILDHRSEFHQALVHAGQLVDGQPPDNRVQHVGDVVQFLRQGVDILAVERRDEGPVQPVYDRVRGLVAPMLDVPHLRQVVHGQLAFRDHFLEEDRRRDGVVRLLLQQVEELEFLGEKSEKHPALLRSSGFARAGTRISGGAESTGGHESNRHSAVMSI